MVAAFLLLLLLLLLSFEDETGRNDRDDDDDVEQEVDDDDDDDGVDALIIITFCVFYLSIIKFDENTGVKKSHSLFFAFLQFLRFSIPREKASKGGQTSVLLLKNRSKSKTASE